MRFITLSLFIFTFYCFGQYKTSSVLSTGDWYRIGVTQNGVHKLDFDFFKNIGIDLNKTNPATIQVYGNGGAMLPQPNATPRTDDLVECPIYASGTEDGTFDKGDYLLFYALGVDSWKYQPNNKQFVHTKNLYADTAYYFITTGQQTGKRVATMASEVLQTNVLQTFDAHLFYEKDLTNLIKSGREWYGEAFDGSLTQSFAFDTPNISQNSAINANITVMVKPSNTAQTLFKVNLNSKVLGNVVSNACNCGSNSIRGVNTANTFSANAAELATTDKLNFTFTYDKSADGGAVGYLNYIELNFKQNIALSGSQTAFRSIGSADSPLASYSISDVNTSSLIWDVTDLHQVKNMPYSGSNPVVFTAKTDNVVKEYVVFDPTKVNLVPSFTGKVSNQNLHGSPVPDAVIVTHPSLMSQAVRLADFRKSQGINVLVVSVQQVYNEFSSGAQDITAIRDFCRMLKKKGNLKNLILFGSCSYDYKNRIINNTNLVPVYEAYESLHEVNSYSSDDYFGLLDDNEGAWVEGAYEFSTLDIGIGRLPIKNSIEAKNVVDKLIHYSSSDASLGRWRNKIAYLCDNGDGNAHLADADRLATRIDSTTKLLNINKVYLDAYPLVSTPAGSTSPDTRQAIRDVVNQGSLIINYSGHGGPEQLTQENIINVNDIGGWKNFDKLPFFVTATCDFGVYDNPSEVSGGMLLLTAERGGGIGVITAGRPVYQNTNYVLNNAFYDVAFKADSLGNMPTLGDIIRQTKNRSLAGVNNRSYALLGDPSMTLNYPKYKVIVTSVNGQNINALSDTIKALSTIKIEGELRDQVSNAILTDFNGVVNSDIYDKYAILSTLGQYSDPVQYKLRNNTIQSGQATVKNGKFSFTFIVPKDINYQFDKGKISLYAYQNGSMTDAAGFNTNIIIGGSNPNAPIDTTAPQIKLYMDDESFINGGFTGTEPMLIAKLYDEHGINIAKSGIGHELAGQVSTEPSKTLILNDYYTSNLDDFKRGIIKYKLNTLPEGTHSFKLKAWDTYNNSSEASIEFIVASSVKIAIQKLFNYPNPFADATTFQVQHNRAGEDLILNLKIFSLDGKLVKEFNEDIILSNATIQLPWDLFDTAYTILPGMYVYHCTLTSKKDNTFDKALQKLVLIH